MPRKRKSLSIGPRQLYIMMESIAAAISAIKGDRSYTDMPRDEYKGIAEASDLFLELEEQWDALSPFRPRHARESEIDARFGRST